MNFNIFFLLFVLVACGVKSNPVPPKGTALPSYIDKFLETEEGKKNEKKSETTSGS